MLRKDWFIYYCRHFDCIEINSSSYRIPGLKSLQKWYEESPEGFLFSMKAPRLATHYKQLKDCSSLMAGFYALLQQGLKEKLGAVLYQFPPAFGFSEENLQLILQTVDTACRNVVEFRSPGWWNPAVIEALGAKDVTFCGISYPGTLPDEAIVNTGTGYYRFHGKPVLYQSPYPENLLMQVYKEIKNAGVSRAFLLFNNTWGGAALANACQIREIIYKDEDKGYPR